MDKELLHMQVEAIYERLGDRHLVISLNRAAQLLGKDRPQAVVDGLYPALGHQTHCMAADVPGVNSMVGVPFPVEPMIGQRSQSTQTAPCFLVPHSLRRCGTAKAPCIAAGSPGLERAKSKGCSKALLPSSPYRAGLFYPMRKTKSTEREVIPCPRPGLAKS